MRNRRIFLTAAMAVGVAYASVAPAAKADQDVPVPVAGKGKAKAKPPVAPPPPHKSKPAAAPKEAAKPAAPETAGPSKVAKPEPARTAHEVVEHESRIEFDERMVKGQSAAGAIFLFQRTPSEFKSIVEVPDSFRVKTVDLLQPRRATP